MITKRRPVWQINCNKKHVKTRRLHDVLRAREKVMRMPGRIDAEVPATGSCRLAAHVERLVVDDDESGRRYVPSGCHSTSRRFNLIERPVIVTRLAQTNTISNDKVVTRQESRTFQMERENRSGSSVCRFSPIGRSRYL